MTQKTLTVCATCNHAEWKRTSNGRAHPDGSGVCRYRFPDGPLPKWALGTYRVGYAKSVRALLDHACGGRWICRYESRIEDTQQPCATWEAKP
jgi:hypothetical protein